MTRLRTFDEHLPVYLAFACAVAAFDAATWKRIVSRCATFDDASVWPLLERAHLVAVPHGYPTGIFRPAIPLPVRALAGVLEVVQTSLLVAYELTQLIPALRDGKRIRRTKSTGSARTDSYIDADIEIEIALSENVPSSPTVAAAVRAAGAAVLRHDYLSAADFARSYFAIAPEISFADLESRARPMQYV